MEKIYRHILFTQFQLCGLLKQHFSYLTLCYMWIHVNLECLCSIGGKTDPSDFIISDFSHKALLHRPASHFVLSMVIRNFIKIGFELFSSSSIRFCIYCKSANTDFHKVNQLCRFTYVLRIWVQKSFPNKNFYPKNIGRWIFVTVIMFILNVKRRTHCYYLKVHKEHTGGPVCTLKTISKVK